MERKLAPSSSCPTPRPSQVLDLAAAADGADVASGEELERAELEPGELGTEELEPEEELALLGADDELT